MRIVLNTAFATFIFGAGLAPGGFTASEGLALAVWVAVMLVVNTLFYRRKIQQAAN